MNAMASYLDNTIRKTYSFYNGQGFKRKNHLKQTCEKNSVKFYSLSDIIAIRWVASDQSAMKKIHIMWRALVKDLKEIENDNTEFEEKTRIKAKRIGNKLVGKNFLAMFYFIFDILNELSVVSQNMQKREGLVLNIQSFKQNLESIFNYLKTKNGKFLEIFLNDAKCDAEPCLTIENYLRSNTIKYHDVMLRDDKEDIPEISAYRIALMNALLNQFEKYFPDGHLDSFDVFDHKKLPDPNNYVAIRTYGVLKIKDLNMYFKVCEEETIINEWQSVLAEILSNPNFCIMQSSRTSASAFWSQALKWTEITWKRCI